nr:MAG: putative nucleoprotein [Hangzhou phenuivirus 3]
MAQQQVKNEVVGATIDDLAGHMTASEMTIQGITREDFNKLHSSPTFDFAVLLENFMKVSPDLKDVTQDPSKSLEFCSKILFTIAPESRAVRKGATDKVWRLNFLGGENVPAKTILVATFKNAMPKNVGIYSKNQLVLSMKQAGLIAVHVLNQYTPWLVTAGSKILTPLAGAVFNKDDLEKIVKKLGDTNLEKLIICINSSCQSGGQHLPDSRAHIAAVAAICATKNMKRMEDRVSIIGKIVKQYLNMKKPLDINKFKIYAAFAHGGVPAEFQPENLIKIADTSNKEMNDLLVAALKETAVAIGGRKHAN